MKDRIRKVMESLHMTQQVFAEFINISPASLSSVFNGRTRPTLNMVEAIKNKIPSISTDWLMFGMGSMYISDQKPDEAAGEGSVSQPVEAILDFEVASSVPVSRESVHPLRQEEGNSPHHSSVKDVKYIDKPKRIITEIRVFYNDQTWESFVAKK